jgi:hypothetical protein
MFQGYSEGVKIVKFDVGSKGHGNTNIKYGDRFPAVGEEFRMTSQYGSFTIKYTWVGTPEWTPKHTVRVPVKFIITEVIEISNKGKVKQSGFEIIK